MNTLANKIIFEMIISTSDVAITQYNSAVEFIVPGILGLARMIEESIERIMLFE